MHDGQMRIELKKAYPGSTTWTAKVNNMSEAQLLAVYLRFKKEGKI
jgi:hypothetical protein